MEGKVLDKEIMVSRNTSLVWESEIDIVYTGTSTEIIWNIVRVSFLIYKNKLNTVILQNKIEF